VSVNLGKLVEDILKESRAKADDIRKEGMAQIEERVARARTMATREADLIARNTRTECDAAINRQVSQEKQKARLAYLTEKNSVLDGIMREVDAKLVGFSSSRSCAGWRQVHPTESRWHYRNRTFVDTRALS